MRDLLKILLLCVACIVPLVGCSPHQCDCCDNQCCEGDSCCDNPFDCDALEQCPYLKQVHQNTGPVGGIEIGAPREGAVDSEKLNEVKDDCATCPYRVPAMQPYPSNAPAAVPSSVAPATKLASINAEREGAFRCDRCNKPTVGKDWHEIWTDDDTPLVCMCEKCWHQSSPAERQSILSSFVKRSNLPSTQRFYAEQLINSID